MCNVVNDTIPFGMVCSVPSGFPELGVNAMHFRQLFICVCRPLILFPETNNYLKYSEPFSRNRHDSFRCDTYEWH